MKHEITRNYVLSLDEVRQAVIYWLKEFCDKPVPSDRDIVKLFVSGDDADVAVTLLWTEKLGE